MDTGLETSVWDVVIVGAGPAGLSAALILARCCRKVLLCDRGTPRSWASKAMYGFLSRDAIAPDEFRSLSKTELKKYPNVEYRQGEVTRAERMGTLFQVLIDGTYIKARKILIATGVMDSLPTIEGFAELFGRGVFQCPYCDGWEFRDQRIAVYGKGRRGLEMGRALTAWTSRIVVCTDGPSELPDDERQQLQRNGIELVEDELIRLVSVAGQLQHLEFENSKRIDCDAVFFDTPSYNQSTLSESLGCKFDSRGGILCDHYEATSVPGVYAAGNIVKDVQLSVVAAAEGARAAFGINRSLTRESFLARSA